MGYEFLNGQGFVGLTKAKYLDVQKDVAEELVSYRRNMLNGACNYSQILREIDSGAEYLRIKMRDIW